MEGMILIATVVLLAVKCLYSCRLASACCVMAQNQRVKLVLARKPREILSGSNEVRKQVREPKGTTATAQSP